jgi:hypothetical protein
MEGVYYTHDAMGCCPEPNFAEGVGRYSDSIPIEMLKDTESA